MWKIASVKPLSIIFWLEDANIILDQYKPTKALITSSPLSSPTHNFSYLFLLMFCIYAYKVF
jgi:hypothetical protein